MGFPAHKRCGSAFRILLGVNDTTIALNTTLEPKRTSLRRYTITLNSLSPFPMVSREIHKREYAAALVVTEVR
jgi:hypothetical protein